MAKLEQLAGRTSYYNFDPRKLTIDPALNARNMDSSEVQEHIEQLAQSIAVHGVRVPLEVYKTEDDQVIVTSGHCRLKATLLAISRGASIVTVPCIAESRGANDVVRRLRQSIDNSGLRLTPLEEGRNIRYAHERGWKIEDIAREIGRSVSHVRIALDFQGADSEVHTMVQEGKVSATLAAEVAKKEGANAAETLRTAVRTAKAQGKDKATRKHLEPRPALGRKGPSPESQITSAKEVKIARVGPSLIRLNIAGKEHVYSHNFWGELANRLLDFIEGKAVA